MMRWTTHHVKGHQDEDKPLENLDRWAKLNILMNKKAKSLLKQHPQHPQQFVIPFEPWSIWYQGKKLTKEKDTTIYNIVHAPAALSYWGKKGSLSQEEMGKIDWKASKRAAK